MQESQKGSVANLISDLYKKKDSKKIVAPVQQILPPPFLSLGSRRDSNDIS